MLKHAQGYKSRYLKKVPTLESELEKQTLGVLRDKGVPDDVVLLDNGQAIFIEFKNPRGSGVISKLQQHQIDKIKENGFLVFIVDSLKSADECIDKCIELMYD
jgi:hypothetical protein